MNDDTCKFHGETCASVTNLKERVQQAEEDTKEHTDRLYEKLRGKVDRWLFLWLTGGLAALIVGCYGFMWETNRDIQKNVEIQDARHDARFRVLEQNQTQIRMNNAVRDQQYKEVVKILNRIESQQATLLLKIEKLYETRRLDKN